MVNIPRFHHHFKASRSLDEHKVIGLVCSNSLKKLKKKKEKNELIDAVWNAIMKRSGAKNKSSKM